jgi:hypothetical protein
LGIISLHQVTVRQSGRGGYARPQNSCQFITTACVASKTWFIEHNKMLVTQNHLTPDSTIREEGVKHRLFFHCLWWYRVLRKQRTRTNFSSSGNSLPHRTESPNYWSRRLSTMLSRISPHVGVFKSSRLRSMMKEVHSRGYSAAATYSSFPATLMRLNAGPVYKPFYFERPIQSKEQITVVEFVQSQANHQSDEPWTSCIGMSSH